MKLSILMPVYNEAATVRSAIKRVLDVPYPCEMELVVVEDGSTDDTKAVLAGIDDPRVVQQRTTATAARVRRSAPPPVWPPATT